MNTTTDLYPCPGNGMCLYEDEPGQFSCKDYMTCEFGCQPVKCPNYEVCGSAGPEWMLGCTRGTCGYCMRMKLSPPKKKGK